MCNMLPIYQWFVSGKNNLCINLIILKEYVVMVGCINSYIQYKNNYIDDNKKCNLTTNLGQSSHTKGKPLRHNV